MKDDSCWDEWVEQCKHDVARYAPSYKLPPGMHWCLNHREHDWEVVLDEARHRRGLVGYVMFDRWREEWLYVKPHSGVSEAVREKFGTIDDACAGFAKWLNAVAEASSIELPDLPMGATWVRSEMPRLFIVRRGPVGLIRFGRYGTVDTGWFVETEQTDVPLGLLPGLATSVGWSVRTQGACIITGSLVDAVNAMQWYLKCEQAICDARGQLDDVFELVPIGTHDAIPGWESDEEWSVKERAIGDVADAITTSLRRVWPGCPDLTASADIVDGVISLVGPGGVPIGKLLSDRMKEMVGV